MIATPRLRLRRFRPGDDLTYRFDEEIARFQDWNPSVSAADLAGGSPDEPGWFQYAIELTATGELIGDLGVNTHENRMQATIGFTLASGFHGQGYATEAVRALLDHLFRERGLHKVSAECDARNEPSARLLRRVGFTQEGHRRRHTWFKGEWTDDLLFGLLRADWAAAHPR